MARFSNRRVREEEDTELNMVPIMNMFMVLIPFLLMSAAFYHIKAVNTSIPVHGNAPTEENISKPEEEKIKITVVLELKQNQIAISAMSDKLDGNALAALEKQIHRPAGDISVAQVAEFLKRIKTRYPASDTLLLIPDGDVSYDEIIQAMDCARSYESNALFPNVVLSGSLG